MFQLFLFAAFFLLPLSEAQIPDHQTRFEKVRSELLRVGINLPEPAIRYFILDSFFNIPIRPIVYRDTSEIDELNLTFNTEELYKKVSNKGKAKKMLKKLGPEILARCFKITGHNSRFCYVIEDRQTIFIFKETWDQNEDEIRNALFQISNHDLSQKFSFAREYSVTKPKNGLVRVFNHEMPLHGFMNSHFLVEAAESMGMSPFEWFSQVYIPQFALHYFKTSIVNGLHFMAHTQNLWIQLFSPGEIHFDNKDLRDLSVDQLVLTERNFLGPSTLRHPINRLYENQSFASPKSIYPEFLFAASTLEGLMDGRNWSDHERAIILRTFFSSLLHLIQTELHLTIVWPPWLKKHWDRLPEIQSQRTLPFKVDTHFELGSQYTGFYAMGFHLMKELMEQYHLYLIGPYKMIPHKTAETLITLFDLLGRQVIFVDAHIYPFLREQDLAGIMESSNYWEELKKWIQPEFRFAKKQLHASDRLRKSSYMAISEKYLIQLNPETQKPRALIPLKFIRFSSQKDSENATQNSCQIFLNRFN